MATLRRSSLCLASLLVLHTVPLMLTLRAELESEEQLASCADGSLFEMDEGPCQGFDTLTAVRQQLWTAWEKCIGPDRIEATFTATAFGRGEQGKALSGQSVSVVLGIQEWQEPLTLNAVELPPAPKRSFPASLFGPKLEVKELPRSGQSAISSVEQITRTSFTLRDKGTFVAEDPGSSGDFLEVMTACATLNRYDMLPKRKEVKASTIANLEDWTYGVSDGRAMGMGKKKVEMQIASDASIVSRPWADVALRIIPSLQMDLPVWLWGSKQEEAWWPAGLRFGHYVNKFDSYCQDEGYGGDGCSGYMMGLDGKNEKGNPLSLAIYANYMDPNFLGMGGTPAVIIKRGKGKDEELFKIGFTSGASDMSTKDKYGGKAEWIVLDRLVTVQLPGHSENLQCMLMIDVNLQDKRAFVSLEQDEDHATELTAQVCNLKESIPKDNLNTFDFFAWK